MFVRRARYTSAGQTCKGAPYKGETKGVVCKLAWPCEDTLEAPYEAKSYCNALEKRVKLLVKGGKGVIEVEECSQSPL
jgi:hypothetical protein